MTASPLHGRPKYWREVAFEKAPDAVTIVFSLNTSEKARPSGVS